MQTLWQVDAVLDEAVRAGEIVGIVALAATADGPLYEGAFGKRVLDGDAPMTRDTVFWLASMTKAVTSVAAMQLVEHGHLHLDRPASEVVPDLTSPLILDGFNSAGIARTRRASRPITLRHLLTHTAGFGYDMWSDDLVRYQAQSGIASINSCEHAALSMPLLFEPGERWEYGISIDWVGKMVETVSGQNLAAYLRDNIFEPLGMRDTAFKLGASQRARLAGMHARLPDGALRRIPFEVPQEPQFFSGGGGLYGTAADYLIFLQMLLHDGTFNGAQILQPRTAAQMMENHIGHLEVQMLTSALPRVTNDVHFFGTGQKWGLGFLLHTSAGSAGRSAGSIAWAGLGNTFYWIDRGRKLCAVMCTQILPFADPAVLRLYERFEIGVYEAMKSVA